MSGSMFLARVSGAFLLVAALVAPMTLTAAAEPAAPTASTVVPQPATKLTVETEDRAPINSRDDYVNATLTLDGTTHTMRIKGRGNSTWQWPKKPYKMKLDEDAALIGDVPQEDWVLLANYRDRAALRTALAFTLASRTSLAWTPKYRFVELELNGEARGLYLLSEQVEQGTGRVDLPDGSYLLEINERMEADGELGFWTVRRTPVTFKDPDELSAQEQESVRSRVERFENILYGKGFTHPDRGYAQHVNIESFVDWYLVEELFANQDSSFRSSVNISLTPDGTFTMGPVWDFDLSAGTRWNATHPPKGWYTRNGNHWISRMLQDPTFAARVKERWNELRPMVDQLVAEIDESGDVLRDAAEADWQQWHNDLTEWSAHASNFSGELSYLRLWLRDRAEWMSRNESMWGAVNMMTRERARTVWVPVRLHSPSGHPVRVKFEVAPGTTATPGVDFERTPGMVTFAPGTVVRYIPVQIFADEEQEKYEHIKIKLSTSEEDTIIGAPDVLTVTIGASDQTVDASIRRQGQKAYRGDGVIDPFGARQMLKGRVRAGKTRTFEVKVKNPGNANNRVHLKAARSGPARVRWYLGRRDVTAGINAGMSTRILPGQARNLRAVVTTRRSAKAGQYARLRLRTVWAGDQKVVDRVGAQLIIRPGPRG